MRLDLDQFKQLRTTHSKPNAVTIEALWRHIEHLYTVINLQFDQQRDQRSIEEITSKQLKIIMARVRGLEARISGGKEQ